MKIKFSYNTTIKACYVGNISMAVIASFLPLIFITLREQFGLSYTQLGMLTFINFLTQVVMDFVFGPLVDKYGFRRFIVSSTILTIIGFALFASTPWITDKPYPLFIVGTIIYSGSCGLLELLLSPIINTVPTDAKAKAMSMLHAFYCWGVIIVVVVSTVLLKIFGMSSWQYVMLMWTVVPLVDFFLFLKVPLANPVPEGKKVGFRELPNKRLYVLLCAMICCGAASELIMGQWASAFVEKALGVSKIVGDIAGVCMFAFTMGIGRIILGKKGEQKSFDINKYIGCLFVAAAVCYLVTVFSNNNLFALLGCAATGFCVSALWPGSLISVTRIYPFASAWMFAVMSGFGDMGGAFGAWIAGKVIDFAQTVDFIKQMSVNRGIDIERLGLKSGMFLGVIFSVFGFILSLITIHNVNKLKNKNIDNDVK